MTVRVFVSIVVLAAGSGLLWLPARAPASALDDLRDAAGRDLPNVPEPSAPTPDDDDGYAERRERYRQMQEEEEREKEARRQQWEQEARERQERDERERQEDQRRQQEESDRRDEQRREQQVRDQEDHYSRQREEDEEVVQQADQRREEQQRLQAEQQRRDQAENARQAELRRQKEAARLERLRQEQLAKERREQEERARQEALRRQQEEEARQARLRAQAAAARAQWAADDERNGNSFDDIFAGATESDPNVVDLSDSTSLTPALLRGGGPHVSLRIKPPPLPRPEVTMEVSNDPRELPPPPPRWHPDMKGKLTDLGFAYVSMYLKSKVDGLASIPELAKDAVDLRKRLGEHTTGYLDGLFATARQATDPNANLGALSERTWTRFERAAADYDEDARRGMQNNAATMSSGSLPEGSSAAEVGIGQGQAQLQDVQELRKWTEEHGSDGR